MVYLFILGELEKTNKEEAHLRSIWRELGVGHNGYLTLKELSKVCQHIGMNDMDGDVSHICVNQFEISLDSDLNFSYFFNVLDLQ